MRRTRVANIRDLGHPYPANNKIPDDGVYIGRGSKWGNPFSHLPSSYPNVIRVATREEAVRRHAEWILTQPELLAALPELVGKTLWCHCTPALCHGNILAALANELSDA